MTYITQWPKVERKESFHVELDDLMEDLQRKRFNLHRNHHLGMCDTY